MTALVDSIRELITRRDTLAAEIARKLDDFQVVDREVQEALALLTESRDRQPGRPSPPATAPSTPISPVTQDASPLQVSAEAAPVPTTPRHAIKVCPLCDREYIRTSNRQQICPACRSRMLGGNVNIEVLLERKRKGFSPFQPWPDRTCDVDVCGKTYTPKNQQQRICDECREKYGPRGPGRINASIRRAAARSVARVESRWMGKSRAEFSSAASKRAEELKTSKSSSIVRTPLNFV